MEGVRALHLHGDGPKYAAPELAAVLLQPLPGAEDALVPLVKRLEREGGKAEGWIRISTGGARVQRCARRNDFRSSLQQSGV